MDVSQSSNVLATVTWLSRTLSGILNRYCGMDAVSHEPWLSRRPEATNSPSTPMSCAGCVSANCSSKSTMQLGLVQRERRRATHGHTCSCADTSSRECTDAGQTRSTARVCASKSRRTAWCLSCAPFAAGASALAKGFASCRRIADASLRPTHRYRCAFRSRLRTTVRFKYPIWTLNSSKRTRRRVYVGSPEHTPPYPRA